MLKKLYAYQDDAVVTLVPNTGIQFLDFGVGQAFAKSVLRSYWCEVKPGVTDADGKAAEDLHPLVRDAEQGFYFKDSDGQVRYAPEDDVLTRNGDQALEKLSGRWLPLPILRVLPSEEVADGPTNWARLFITRLAEPDERGNIWRLTVALDTLLADRRDGHPYTMPEPKDARDLMVFTPVSDPEKLRFFLTTSWVRNWLREAYVEAENRGVSGRGRRKTLEDLPHPGAYWAYYLTVLAVLCGNEDSASFGTATDPNLAGPKVPRLRFIDESLYGPHRKPIPVDLVLDIGNSRTCGLFIEEGEGTQRLDMSQVYRLEVRDLSNPAQVCAEPFESRLEFHAASFNLGNHSRESRRPKRDAFWWPSPVRVGPEAAWLSTLSDGTHGESGLSSPKRYLWDGQARRTPWVNNHGTLSRSERVPPIRGPIPSKLTRDGKVVRPGDPSRTPGMEACYARNSLYMLMLVEVLIHALAQINAPGNRAYRARAEEPRQLRTVILTVPSATPVAEQRILKGLVKTAVDLLWQVMDWDDGSLIRKKPSLKMDWDEATATHLVYLYNEITQKVQGAPRDFFRSLARVRSDGSLGGAAGDVPSLRVASMDMGGGTTDLMIIEHQVVDNDRTIVPHQLFREGFRLAGDDIVKQVIETLVMPCLGKALADAETEHHQTFLAERFGGDREGMAQQDRTLRALFVNQVFKPAALRLMGLYESTVRRGVDETLSFTLGDLLNGGAPVSAAVRGYVEEAARRADARAFSLDAVLITVTTSQMEATVRGVVSTMLTDLCDVVRAYDCDILLLSGRPSAMPIIKDMVVGQMPVPVHRIIPMNGYDVGNWYPFHSPTFRIEDPKTTAAVGAILCQVAEGRIEGMLMRSSEIRMTSTARFIGVMERNDQIHDEKLFFSDIDLDTERAETSRPVTVTPPAFLGYRQLPMERWKTTPLYFLSFRNAGDVSQYRMPVTLTLVRDAGGSGADEEALTEEFAIAEAVDRLGTDCGHALRLSFQSLRVEREQEAGYWLDSGVLKVSRD